MIGGPFSIPRRARGGSDDVLTQSIVELRKAFDDDAKHPQFIETIPKVGLIIAGGDNARHNGGADPGR